MASSSSPLILKATKEPYHEPVTFERPVIGPKIYLARGPSGWREKFCRKEADARLKEYLDPVDPDDVADTFVITMELSNQEEHWNDVVEYLAGIVGKSWREVPEIVGVAFWARAILVAKKKRTN